MNIAKALIGWANCALVLLVVGSSGVARGQTDAAGFAFKTLHSFTGADGDIPYGPLVQAANGEFYGATDYGGPDCALTMQCSTMFKISPTGSLATIYNFCPQSVCPLGVAPVPQTPLVQATNGYLYGLTVYGGPGGYEGGTFFRVSPSGTLTTLYNFCSESGCADGYLPSNLLQAANGEMYGTTAAGGNNTSCGVFSSCGTIFKITPSGSLTTLHRFCSQPGCPDGFSPNSLIQAASGELYGTTGGDNSSCPPQGSSCGTLFKVSPSGVLTTLYTFCSQSGCLDGANPYEGLLQTSNGDIYGSTIAGGAGGYCPFSFGCGTIYKIDLSGKMTTLYSFCSLPACADGRTIAGLIQAASGKLYGITTNGGANCPNSGGCGTIFEITTSGTFRTLYSFCSQAGCPDGEGPFGGLTQGTNGVFYGTATGGGANGYGTVFTVSTGEHPFVETRPTRGKVGETVTILGYGLKGATSVTFNGTPATILYDAPTVIYAEVPTVATTGKVQVVTPTETLVSNVDFVVR